MTDKRKEELLNACIGWICEVVSKNEDLYSSLHNVIGLSDSEIEEVGIDYLNEYFTDEPVTDNEDFAEEDNNSFRMGGM